MYRDVSVTIKCVRLFQDSAKAKGFLPFLQRAGRTEAVVEFVASGSRVRLFIPRETCLITFLLAGISCPRATRPAPGGIGTLPGEPYGEEALALTKSLILQREVEIEVNNWDYWWMLVIFTLIMDLLQNCSFIIIILTKFMC